MRNSGLLICLLSLGLSACTTNPTSNPDTTPPVVSNLELTPSLTVSQISASASDAVGVVRVEFYVGSRLIGDDTAAPYSMSAQNLPFCSNTEIVVRAFDAAGNQGEARQPLPCVDPPSS